MIDPDMFEFVPEVDPSDPVAARCGTYTTLLSTLAAIKDKELRQEGLLMLSAIRRSFATMPQGEIKVLN